MQHSEGVEKTYSTTLMVDAKNYHRPIKYRSKKVREYFLSDESPDGPLFESITAFDQPMFTQFEFQNNYPDDPFIFEHGIPIQKKNGEIVFNIYGYSGETTRETVTQRDDGSRRYRFQDTKSSSEQSPYKYHTVERSPEGLITKMCYKYRGPRVTCHTFKYGTGTPPEMQR